MLISQTQRIFTIVVQEKVINTIETIGINQRTERYKSLDKHTQTAAWKIKTIRMRHIAIAVLTLILIHFVKQKGYIFWPIGLSILCWHLYKWILQLDLVDLCICIYIQKLPVTE